MSKRIRIWGACCVIGLVFCLVIWVFGGKPVPNIQLRASFEALTDAENSGYDFYTNKIFNDEFGPYVGIDDKSVEVYITGDTGDLFFKIEHHARRKVNVVFPLASSEVGFLPDTVGIYDNLPDEPVDFFRFKTYSRYTSPPVNLLTMAKEVATKLTLWTTVCTIDRHYFLLNYNEPVLDKISGHVQVTAYDDDGNGVLDRWVFEPLEGTNSLVRLIKQEGSGKNQYHSDFGWHNMPFKLTLERIK